MSILDNEGHDPQGLGNSVTARAMQRVREEWEAPLRAEIARLRADLTDARDQIAHGEAIIAKLNDELAASGNHADVALSEENDRLMAEVERLRDALADLCINASLLQQNSVGCAVNHHALDLELMGLPGWLTDTKASIDRAIALLGHHKRRENHGPRATT